MFLNYMARGYEYKKFLENFSADLHNNNKIVEEHVKFEDADCNIHGDGSCYLRCLQSSKAIMSLL